MDNDDKHTSARPRPPPTTGGRHESPQYRPRPISIVPEPEEDDLDSGALELIESLDLDARDQRKIQHLRLAPSDPYEQIYRTAKVVRRLQAEIAALTPTVSTAEKWMGHGVKVALLIISGLIGGVGYAIHTIQSSAERVGTQTEQLRVLDREFQQQREEIRDMRREKDKP